MSSNPQQSETTAKVERTPGPFRLIPHAGSDEFSVEGGKGQMVANFAGAASANKANALLYMAGEDMLAALEELTGFCEIVLDHGRLSGGQMARKYDMDPMRGYEFVESHCKTAQRKIRAAIAKAERGQ